MSDKWSGTRKRAAETLLANRNALYLNEYIAEKLAVNHPTIYLRYVDSYRMKKMAEKQKAAK